MEKAPLSHTETRLSSASALCSVSHGLWRCPLPTMHRSDTEEGTETCHLLLGMREFPSMRVYCKHKHGHVRDIVRSVGYYHDMNGSIRNSPPDVYTLCMHKIYSFITKNLNIMYKYMHMETLGCSF